MRDILYPKVFKYNFYNESLKFCAILGSFAIIGLCYTTPIMVENDTDDFTIIDRALNLFAIAVPPALPAAVGAGVAFASRRLRNQKREIRRGARGIRSVPEERVVDNQERSL